MPEQILTFDAGYRRLLAKLISRGFKLDKIKPINNGRYLIAIGKENILIMFKRDVFHNFGKQFKEEGFKGVGDTINVDDLKLCIQNKVKKIFSIFLNGRAYSIDIKDFLEKSIRWMNKEGKEVRSISIHEYSPEGEI